MKDELKVREKWSYRLHYRNGVGVVQSKQHTSPLDAMTAAMTHTQAARKSYMQIDIMQKIRHKWIVRYTRKCIGFKQWDDWKESEGAEQ